MYFFTRAWILLSALLVSAGWILSALHQLNRTGYLIFFILAAVVFFVFLKKHLPARDAAARDWKKTLHRFRRPPAFLFLLLALLALFSGSIYPAFNWDSNAYRLPRIFHWLGNEQWNWIHTVDFRMNIAGCNFEWLAAPLVLFSHSDRLMFLVNWLSYLLLPGLIFSLFTRWNVRPRVAWWWMWWLAAGWCFVFQAGSVANDSFAVIYALAAADLAMRARASKKISDLWLSVLAIALATGVKQTNLPLVLVWLVAAWPALPLLLKNKTGTLAVGAAALLVSILPVSIFNLEHYGTWMPVQTSAMAGLGKFELNPWWGIVGNAFCLPLQNLVPPFYEWLPPYYYNNFSLWNDLLENFRATPFGAHFASFETFGFLSAVREHGVSEANAGIGLGICFLTAVSILTAAMLRRRAKINSAGGKYFWLLRAAPWAALLVFMAKVGSYENARQLGPYYPLLFPIFLTAAGHGVLVRRRLWQWCGLATMIFSVFLLVTLVQRPLFPTNPVFGFLREKFPNNQQIQLETVQYLGSTGWMMENRRQCVRQSLPPDAKMVGYFASVNNGDEAGLWLPLGQRRVEWILPDDAPESVRAANIHYAVISSVALDLAGTTLPAWLQKYNAKVLSQYSIYGEPVASPPPDDFRGFYVAQLN